MEGVTAFLVVSLRTEDSLPVAVAQRRQHVTRVARRQVAAIVLVRQAAAARRDRRVQRPRRHLRIRTVERERVQRRRYLSPMCA